jgi:hypothetical protein
MEIGKAISFITEDPRWQQKVMVGTGVILASMVLSPILIGIVGFLILTGYSVRLLQNVRDGRPFPLPEWDQWGDDLIRGFKLAVVGIVWALPVIALMIPSFIGGALSESRSDAAQFVGVMISICAGCLTFLYSLFMAAVWPGYSIAFARDERTASGLRFRDILAWTRDNIGQVIVVVLVVIVASIVIGLVAAIGGVLLCLVGLIVTIPLGSLVATLFEYHLIGQLAYAYPMGGGPEMPAAPPVAPESGGEAPQEPPAA